MQTARVHYIDCLRLFACLLVVAVHCNFMPENPNDHIWAQILGVLGAPSSELFLAISGSLLIPVRTTQQYFYKRRFAKLLPPLLLWSVVGIAFFVLTGQRSASEIGYMLFGIYIIYDLSRFCKRRIPKKENLPIIITCGFICLSSSSTS